MEVETIDKTVEMCLHQFVRPSQTYLNQQKGNCSICKTDSNNQYCERYTRISVSCYSIDKKEGGK